MAWPTQFCFSYRAISCSTLHFSLSFCYCKVIAVPHVIVQDYSINSIRLNKNNPRCDQVTGHTKIKEKIFFLAGRQFRSLPLPDSDTVDDKSINLKLMVS